jgi:hypothetical protein
MTLQYLDSLITHIIKYETEDKEILQVTENVESKNNKQKGL